MNLNIDHIVRSLAVAVVGLPLTLSLNNLVNTTAVIANNTIQTSTVEDLTAEIKGDMFKACLTYMVSKEDSKLERESQDKLDDYLGGDLEHIETCKWVFG